MGAMQFVSAACECARECVFYACIMLLCILCARGPHACVCVCILGHAQLNVNIAPSSSAAAAVYLVGSSVLPP